MRQLLIGFAMLAFTIAFAGSGRSQDAKPANELVGEWEVFKFLDDNIDRMVRLNEKGTPKLMVTEKEIFIVDGEGTRFAGNNRTNIGWTTYILDASKTPKRIVLRGKVVEKGKESDVVYPGIYKIEGDVITIAYPESNQQKIGHPKSFESDDDVNVIAARKIMKK